MSTQYSYVLIDEGRWQEIACPLHSEPKSNFGSKLDANMIRNSLIRRTNNICWRQRSFSCTGQSYKSQTGENDHVEVLVDCFIYFQLTKDFSDMFRTNAQELTLANTRNRLESTFYQQNSISMQSLWLMVYNHV